MMNTQISTQTRFHENKQKKRKKHTEYRKRVTGGWEVADGAKSV